MSSKKPPRHGQHFLSFPHLGLCLVWYLSLGIETGLPGWSEADVEECWKPASLCSTWALSTHLGAVLGSRELESLCAALSIWMVLSSWKRLLGAKTLDCPQVHFFGLLTDSGMCLNEWVWHGKASGIAGL